VQLADRVVERLLPETAAGRRLPAGPRRELACAHLRRGDFEDECRKYDEEMRSGRARPWVKAHFEAGWGCWLDEHELELNFRTLVRQGESRGAPYALFVATEDPAFVAAPRFAKYNLSTFAQLAAADPSLVLPPPAAVSAGLLDQLVCSRAKVLMLNVFSTFSQLAMGYIGLRNAQTLGWVRDLTPPQQKMLGVKVNFWRKANPFRSDTLFDEI
jgi:hypothetical protein